MKTLTAPTTHVMTKPCYEFAAIRGLQAGRSFWTIQCPLKLVGRILTGDDEELAPELRAQRTLNPSRVPGIAAYLTSNTRDYVLPPIIVSIGASVIFSSLEGCRDLGTLRIPMEAPLLINDGQHRRAAIVRALKERPELGDETIPVVLYVDAGLERSQQMFADLNQHGAKPAKSLNVLYDHRDGLAGLARDLAVNNSTFRGLTEMERPSIGKASRKLFTIGAIHDATRALLGLGRKGQPTEAQAKLAHRWWSEVGACIPEWDSLRQLLGGGPTAAELRETKVHAHAVILQALGVVGATLTAENSEWAHSLYALEEVDWSRSAPHWDGRCVVNGTMQKSSACVAATAAYLAEVLA